MTHSVSCPRIKEKNTRFASLATRATTVAARFGRKALRESFTPRISFSLPESMYTEKMKPIIMANTPEATFAVILNTSESISVVNFVASPSTFKRELQLNSFRNSWIKVRSYLWAMSLAQPMAWFAYMGRLRCMVTVSTLMESTRLGMMKHTINTTRSITTRYARVTDTGRRSFFHTFDFELSKGLKAISSKKCTNTFNI